MTDHLPAVRRLRDENGAPVERDAIEPQTVSEFAERIAVCWRKSFEGIIETGRWLTRAKGALDHGEWTQMIEHSLPFKSHTAQRLMAISRDERIVDPAHVRVLPNTWGTLYELTKLDDAAFQQRITDGTIHPDMERRDIATAVKATRRAAREAHLGEMQAAANLRLPDKKYGVILADPEWRFEPWSRETGLDRSPDNHYPTSVTEVIAARPVQDIAAKDCALFLWATVPMLPHALAVMESWGFCVGVGTRVLTADLRWVKAEELYVGQRLLAFDESSNQCGRTDGNPRRYYCWSDVLGTGVQPLPSYRIVLGNGQELIASSEHAWLMRTSTGKQGLMRWVKTKDMVKHLSHGNRRNPLFLPKIAPLMMPNLENVPVEAVEFVGDKECVTLSTSTGTYIAEGFGAHNTYRSHVMWKKDRMGTGYWFRNFHELLLLGIKGNNISAPAPGDQWGSVLEAAVGEHSEKPNCFYELIEAYFPHLPKIELNARRSRPNWDSWGLDVPQAEAAE